MKQLPLAARIYVSLVVLAGAACLGLGLVDLPFAHPFLLAGLRTGADALQGATGPLRVPIATAFMLEGAILLAALGGEVFRRNRLVVRRIAEAPA